MNGRVCGVIVQFSCFQHRHEWMLKLHHYQWRKKMISKKGQGREGGWGEGGGCKYHCTWKFLGHILVPSNHAYAHFCASYASDYILLTSFFHICTVLARKFHLWIFIATPRGVENRKYTVKRKYLMMMIIYVRKVYLQNDNIKFVRYNFIYSYVQTKHVQHLLVCQISPRTLDICFNMVPSQHQLSLGIWS